MKILVGVAVAVGLVMVPAIGTWLSTRHSDESGTSTSADICLAHYRNEFVDPESVRLIGTMNDGSDLWIIMTAGNRMGGRSKIRRSCAVSGGKFDGNGNAMTEATATMEAQNRCLQRRIDALAEARIRGGSPRYVGDCTEADARREALEQW